AFQARIDLGHARIVCGDVVGVAGVVRRRADAAVIAAGGIEVAAGAGGVGRAAVAGLVHVEAVFAAGRKARDLAGDVHATVGGRKPQLARGAVAGGRGQRGNRAGGGSLVDRRVGRGRRVRRRFGGQGG